MIARLTAIDRYINEDLADEMDKMKLKGHTAKTNIVKELGEKIGDDAELALKLLKRVKDKHRSGCCPLSIGFVQFPAPLFLVVRERSIHRHTDIAFSLCKELDELDSWYMEIVVQTAELSHTLDRTHNSHTKATFLGDVSVMVSSLIILSGIMRRRRARSMC